MRQQHVADHLGRGHTPTDPAATGSLDQAPVQVSIITASVTNALVVPVDALLALANGGYAVEVIGSKGVHHLVAVTLGLFDDADGLVQVIGSGLAAGQRVVVPEPMSTEDTRWIKAGNRGDRTNRPTTRRAGARTRRRVARSIPANRLSRHFGE